MKKIDQAFTFDDVLLVPQYSDILPKNVDIRTSITKNIKLNIPIMSAAMDTVTDSVMAIALARQGGIGIVHKNMSISEQCDQIDIVKRSESGMIINPITIKSNDSIKNATDIMSKYKISGLPVIDDGKLTGIITNRDIRFESNKELKVSERMTNKNLITVQEGTTLEQAKKVLQKHRIEKLLVVNKKKQLCGLITVKDILKKQNYPNAAKDKLGRLLVGGAIGVGPDFLERAEALSNMGVDLLVIDTAHGHSKSVLETIKQIKKTLSIDVVAGNVATSEGVQSLFDAGVDAVKIGIGAGSSCTTRIVAGIGAPQLHSVMDAYEIAKQLNISIISDGGMRYSGDIAKSLAAGADAVMLGGLLAGTDESPGERILWEGRSYKQYRGMGSLSAMQSGSSDRYFQNNNTKFVPEGIEGMVPYKGPLADTISQLIGGIKSSMGYCGSKNLNLFRKNAKFIQITNSGIIESHPHDINITKEAPNYRKPKNT